MPAFSHSAAIDPDALKQLQYENQLLMRVIVAALGDGMDAALTLLDAAPPLEPPVSRPVLGRTARILRQEISKFGLSPAN